MPDTRRHTTLSHHLPSVNVDKGRRSTRRYQMNRTTLTMSHEEVKQGPNSIVEPGTKKRKIADAKGRLPRSYAFFFSVLLSLVVHPPLINTVSLLCTARAAKRPSSMPRGVQVVDGQDILSPLVSWPSPKYRSPCLGGVRRSWQPPEMR